MTLVELTGKVATSALRDIGTVTTDDTDVNQLISNVRWGQRGNYLWVPTDCPQRDERLGWTGDTQLFANTGLFNTDAVTFLSHFQDTLIDSQHNYGAGKAQFPWVAPGHRYGQPLPASGWADCGVVVPWTVWQMSGDTTIIDRSWTAMTKYLDWIRHRTGDTHMRPGRGLRRLARLPDHQHPAHQRRLLRLQRPPHGGHGPSHRPHRRNGHL